jgi:IMP dehydrogenase/GMP reductase
MNTVRGKALVNGVALAADGGIVVATNLGVLAARLLAGDAAANPDH